MISMASNFGDICHTSWIKICNQMNGLDEISIKKKENIIISEKLIWCILFINWQLVQNKKIK